MHEFSGTGEWVSDGLDPEWKAVQDMDRAATAAASNLHYLGTYTGSAAPLGTLVHF